MLCCFHAWPAGGIAISLGSRRKSVCAPSLRRQMCFAVYAARACCTLRHYDLKLLNFLVRDAEARTYLLSSIEMAVVSACRITQRRSGRRLNNNGE